MQTFGYPLIAILAFSGLITTVCVMIWGNPVIQNPPQKLRRLSVAGLWSLFIQYFLGVFVRSRQSGLACPNFPNCHDQFFPNPFTLETTAVFLHRWWGILMLGLFFHIALIGAKQAPMLARSTRQGFALSVAQVFLGIGLILGGMSSESQILHTGVGYVLWGIVFYVALRSGGMKWLWNWKAAQ